MTDPSSELKNLEISRVQQRAEEARGVPIQALREYGNCIRGDWGDIDGRSVKSELHDLADAIEGKGNYADHTIEQWREYMGMCPSGEGHWTRHCMPTKTVGEGADAYTYGCGNEPSRW